jgi:hypothetical protein
MAQPNIERPTKANSVPLPVGGDTAAAFQELTKACQEMATRNAGNLTSAMQALSAVKTPTEFMAVQQRLRTLPM